MQMLSPLPRLKQVARASRLALWLFALAVLPLALAGCGGSSGGSTNPLTFALGSTVLPSGTVGVAYSTTVAASGGTPPYAYSLSAGPLPPGISLSSGGSFTGTPTAAGSYPITVQVTDSAGATARGSTTIVIDPAPLSITTAATVSEQANTAFSTTLTAMGGTAPYAFAVSTGSLPAGVALSSGGALSGTATATGAFSFAVTVTDSSVPALTASASFTLNIYNSEVNVNSGTVLATVPATGYGIHTSVYDGSLNDATGLATVLPLDGINVLRYPGGLYSDNYHWAQYSITPFTPPIAAAACNDATGAVVTNGYLAGDTDFGTFVKTLQAVKGQAIVTVNYGTSVSNAMAAKSVGTYGIDDCSVPNTFGQPEEAAAWVAYANGSATNTQAIGSDAAGFNWQTVGFWAGLRAATPLAVDDGYNFLRIGQTTPIGVTYWELGNEIFYNGYNGLNSETDLHASYVYPNGYATAGDTYNSRNGVSALSPTSYGTNAIHWIMAMKAVDPTIKIGLVLSSPNVDPVPASWNPAAIEAVCTGATFDFGIFHYYPGSYNDVQASQLLSYPQSELATLVSNAKTQIAQHCSATTSPVEFFMTETGPNGSYASGTPAAINGLYAANVYVAAFEAGFANVDWLELHTNFLNVTNGVETPTAAYYGVQLANLLAAEGDKLVPATSTNSQVVSYASVKANGQNGVLLINAGSSAAQAVLVTVTGNSIGGMATQYSYGVNTSPSADALNGTTFTVAGNSFLVTVPPYTATTILLP